MFKHITFATLILVTLSVEGWSQEVSPQFFKLSDGSIVAIGKSPKPSGGTLPISFGVTFAKPPVVVVTPNWVGQVGCIETIVKVTENTFSVNSCNAGTDYYVSWIAVGRKN